MLKTTSNLTSYISILTHDSKGKVFDDCNVIVEADIIGNKSETEFFISGARLLSAKLRHSFSIAAMFYYFDLEYYIWFGSDISRYAIGRIFS